MSKRLSPNGQEYISEKERFLNFAIWNSAARCLHYWFAALISTIAFMHIYFEKLLNIIMFINIC